MKFQILNNEELGFFDSNGVKKATMKLSGSHFIIDPADTGGNIIMGEGETINDLEIGIASTPANMTFLGGGTISSNGGTLFIGNSSNSDSIVLTGVTISSSVSFPTGITGSFQGTHTGTFIGDGSQVTGVTATVSPGGDNKNIQFNDNNTDTSGSDNFTFDKTSNTVEITGSLNVSGSASADFFFGDGSGLTNIVGAFPFTGSAEVSGSMEVVGPITASDIAGNGSLNSPFTGSVNVSGSFDLIGVATATSFSGNGSGLTGITSTFAPTGQDKSIQFNKNGSEVSGSAFLLFDYDNSSLYVKEAISASIFTGSFVGDGSQITNGAWSGIFTGSAEITGSLDIIGTTTISNDATITGSLFIEKNNSTLAIGKGVNDGGYDTSTLIGTNARAYSYHATAIGLNTGAKSYAVGIGWYAMQNGGGGFSIGIGSTSHRFNTGGYNVAIGPNTLLSGNGGFNVALGSAAMENGGSNVYNTALGFHTSRNMVGDYNTTLGYQTGHNSSGSKNILIGHQAGYHFTGSNHLIISNNSSSALIQGDFDNDTLYVSGTLVAKEISGSTTDIFQVQSHNGSTLFEVRPGFVQFGNLGDGLGVDFSGGNRYLKFFNTSISAQGSTGISATGVINFSPGSGTNNKVGLLGGGSAYGHVSLAQGSATAFSYPNNMATELIFRRNVNHLAYHAVIRGDDNQYQPVPIYVFGGKHTTNGTFKPIILQHDTSESRGNVGIGLEDPVENLHVSGNLKINGYITGSEFKSFIRQRYYTDTSNNTIKMGSAYELFGTPHSSGGYVYHLYPEGWNSGWSLAIGNTSTKHSFSGTTFTSAGSINTTNISLGPTGLTNFESSPYKGFKYKSNLGWNFAIRNASDENKLIVTSAGNIELSGSLEVGGNQVDFTSLPTSDPGVAGRLYQTGSDAIGATAGFQVVCISEG